jgi:hypothetical protein
LLKLAITTGSLYLIYFKVVKRENFNDFKNFAFEKMNTTESALLLGFVLVLMLVNWGIEALKWHMLIQRLTPVRFLQSLRAIFTGATISFFTPNRVGDFAGRMIFLPTNVRISSILPTFIGNMSQLIVTLCCGSIGGTVLFQYYFSCTLTEYRIVQFSAIFLVILLIYLFLHLNFIVKLRFIKRLKAHYFPLIEIVENYSANDLGKIVTLSFIRYVVFAWQYVLLFQLAAIPLSTVLLFGLVSIIFLVQAIVPSIAILEFAFRGSVALVVLQPFTNSVNAIIVASFSLWFINLVMPAILGSLMIFYFRWKQKMNTA